MALEAWTVYTAIAAITMAYGYKSQQLNDRMTSLGASTLFWFAALYMWVNDHTGGTVIMGVIVHLAPIGAGFAWFMQSLGEYIDNIRSRSGKRDPF